MDKTYCGYKGESRQRKKSRLNVSERLNQAMRGAEGRKARPESLTKRSS